MLASITTTSQNLVEILGAANIEVARSAVNSTGPYKVLIQNLHTNSIYVEFKTTATTTGGVEVSTDASLTFDDVILEDCNIIAVTGTNNDTRIIIN